MIQPTPKPAELAERVAILMARARWQLTLAEYLIKRARLTLESDKGDD